MGNSKAYVEVNGQRQHGWRAAATACGVLVGTWITVMIVALFILSPVLVPLALVIAMK